MLQVKLEAVTNYEFYKFYFVYLILKYNISVIRSHTNSNN